MEPAESNCLIPWQQAFSKIDMEAFYKINIYYRIRLLMDITEGIGD